MSMYRENVVAVVISLIAILFVIGGFASFSGLAAYNNVLMLASEKDVFAPSDVLGVEVVVNLDTVLADETLTLALDGSVFDVVNLKDYAASNNLRYSVAERNGVSVVYLGEPVRVHLAQYVDLSQVSPGKHSLAARLDRSNVEVQETFRISS
ncbi:hypothetical protein HZB03_05450 [Candidatus Woesearchaeota archaeon]|nr:hypothetical protein [Candidatus Woesearchaeota archaeon]